MNLYLIGYRGCGKSTVGRLVARDIRWPHVDSDDQIEAEAGCTIAHIFAAEGEDGFRNREQAVVAEIAAQSGLVVSLGGGAILRAANQAVLRRSGRIVYLEASVATLSGRVSQDAATAARRPALTDCSAEDEIATVLRQRRPIYEALADLIVAGDGRDPEEIAAEIVHKLQM